MNIAESKVFKNKKPKEWSKSQSKDRLHKSIKVTEADNGGFIIDLSIYGDIPDKTKIDGVKYVDRNKRLISKTNPLAEEKSFFEKELDAIEDLVEDTIEFND